MGHHGLADRRRHAGRFRRRRPGRHDRRRAPKSLRRRRSTACCRSSMTASQALYYRRTEGVSPVSAPTMDEAAKVLADPLAYTDEPRLHAALTHLRASAPVSWVEVPNYRPFWAITKHADIMDIERDNMLFTNWPRPVLTTAEGDELQAAVGRAHADPPGRSAAPGGARDRRGLVSAQGDAGVEGPRRRAGQDLRRQDDGRRPRVRLRSAGRGQLPALRDHVAAGPAGGGLSRACSS